MMFHVEFRGCTLQNLPKKGRVHHTCYDEMKRHVLWEGLSRSFPSNKNIYIYIVVGVGQKRLYTIFENTHCEICEHLKNRQKCLGLHGSPSPILGMCLNLLIPVL